jgi:hypothetical protein
MYHVVILELPRLLSHSGVEVMKLCPVMKEHYILLQQAVGSAVCHSESNSLALTSALHMPGADQLEIG